jgi:hypothetical protein
MMGGRAQSEEHIQQNGWTEEEVVELQRLIDIGTGIRLVAKKLVRSQKSIKQKLKNLNISLAASGGNYVFPFYLFTSRRGHARAPWIWEIRRKSRPNEPFLSESGFRSAKVAEEAGGAVLEHLHNETRTKLIQEQRVAELNTKPKSPKPRRPPLTREQRSENGRKAAMARAQALTPEHRSQTARMGGAASKGKRKLNRLRAPPD